MPIIGVFLNGCIFIHEYDSKAMVSKTQVGSALLVVGVFIAILMAQTTVGTVCSNVGNHGDAPGGFEFKGIDGFSIVYTPDGGVNECKAGLLSASVPVGLVIVGVGFIVVGRKRV